MSENEQGIVKNGNLARKAIKNEQGQSKMNELAHNVYENEQGIVKNGNLARKAIKNEQGRLRMSELAHKR